MEPLCRLWQKMWILCALIFTGGTMVVVVASSIKGQCAPQDVELCVAKVKSVYGSQEIVVTHTVKELRELCLHTQEAMDCINAYVSRCLDRNHREIYRELTSGLQDFMTDFCDENSNFSKEYRRHLNCYNNLAQEFRKCSGYMAQAQKEVTTQSLTTDEATKVLCCHYDRTTACFRNTVQKLCTDDAASFIDVIFNKLLSNVTAMLNCRRYVHSSVSCSSASRQVQQIFCSTILVLLTLLAQFLTSTGKDQ